MRNLKTELLVSREQLQEGQVLIDTSGNRRTVLAVSDTHVWMGHKGGGIGKEHPIEHIIAWGNKILIED